MPLVQNEALHKTFHMKMSFVCMGKNVFTGRTTFHMNGFTQTHFETEAKKQLTNGLLLNLKF